ncbi:MAG: group III truncated hemoglobin [Sneathiella sp.]
MESRYLKLEGGWAVKPDGYDSKNAAHRKRLDHQRAVLDLGLSPDALSDIVDEFYGRVRAHPVLAPIFEEKIGARWESHLETMKAFWLSVALNAGTYAGKPVMVHKALGRVTPAHFDIWLGLFQQTVLDVTRSQEACDFLMKRAIKMSDTFKKAMFVA